jgi:3-phosphoshikimate 1-carboxyvinyltransferase
MSHQGSKVEQIAIGPLKRAHGQIILPGSKSISNRSLLLAALASGQTTLTNLLDADDTQIMRAALRQLGLMVQDQNETTCLVMGSGGHFPIREADLFMGNAGTAIRPLTAALVMQQGDYRLSGVARMHERPIRDLVDGLRQIGAVISYLGEEGYPPIQIHASNVSIPKVVRIRGDVSSQFLTALLMALPLLANKAIRIEVIGELISRPYIEITLKLMQRFGVHVDCPNAQTFVIPAQPSLQTGASVYSSPGRLLVEGDASSASYFLAAGAIGAGPVRVLGVGQDSIQGDVAFADALAQMGAVITKGDDWIEAAAPANSQLHGITIDCTAIPDAAMTLAIAALYAKGETRLNGIASWRVKETDRITAMATELQKVGAGIEAGSDYLVIRPPLAWQTPADGIDTYDDHRMAMCFSLAAFGPNPILINDPNCVAKTFPRYFAEFAQIAQISAR